MTTASATEILHHIQQRLEAEDDPAAWEVIVETILADATFLCESAGRPSVVYLEIGACSHWLRPHQSRWLADGGFALPYGYSGGRFNFHALPEFDWAILARWTSEAQDWKVVDKITDKRPLKFRVTIPTRTTRHDQAAVHTIWLPGSPTRPNEKLKQFYGFRKRDGEWSCTAYQPERSEHY